MKICHHRLSCPQSLHTEPFAAPTVCPCSGSSRQCHLPTHPPCIRAACKRANGARGRRCSACGRRLQSLRRSSARVRCLAVLVRFSQCSWRALAARIMLAPNRLPRMAHGAGCSSGCNLQENRTSFPFLLPPPADRSCQVCARGLHRVEKIVAAPECARNALWRRRGEGRHGAARRVKRAHERVVRRVQEVVNGGGS